MAVLEKRCPSCGLSLPEDPRFPREACPACGSFLEEPPLVRGALAAPKALQDFLDLCGPHRDTPARELDDVTAIVTVTPKKARRAPDPDITESVAVRKPKKSAKKPKPAEDAEDPTELVVAPRRRR